MIGSLFSPEVLIPLGLFLVVALLLVLGLCMAAARGDEQLRRAARQDALKRAAERDKEIRGGGGFRA